MYQVSVCRFQRRVHSRLERLKIKHGGDIPRPDPDAIEVPPEVQGLEDCFALVSANKISLTDLERVSIDDVQLFLIYLEWENEERARLDAKREESERRKAATNKITTPR